MVDKKSKKSKSSGIKINTVCPNMPKRKATGWSKLLVEGKPMLVKTCCRSCAIAIKKKLKDGTTQKKDLVLVPLSDAKKLVAAGEKVRDVKVGGVVAGCCGDRSPKRRSKTVRSKKCGSCGCTGNKKRTHKAQKGGAVRAGTVVQNMPVRQRGGEADTRTDKEYRSSWIKILKSAPSRGGQEPPQWVLDEVKTANINTIKAKVKKFENQQKKLKSQKNNTGNRTMAELEKAYRKLYMKYKNEPSCYKEYKGPKVCTTKTKKQIESSITADIRFFYNTKEKLANEVARLELLDSKSNKKLSKTKKQKGGAVRAGTVVQNIPLKH